MKRNYAAPVAEAFPLLCEDILTSSLTDLGIVDYECDYGYWNPPDIY